MGLLFLLFQCALARNENESNRLAAFRLSGYK